MNQPTKFAQVGDVGVQLIVQVLDQDGNVVNIATAITLSIVIGYPDQSAVTKTAALLNSGADGKMVYTTVADDLSQSGEYFIQGIVTMPSATPKHTRQGTFLVYPNLG